LSSKGLCRQHKSEGGALQPQGHKSPSRGQLLRLGSTLSASLALLLVGRLLRLPAGLWLVLVLAFAVSLGWAVSRWLVERFGSKAAVAMVAVALLGGGFVARAYWLDEPNRRLVAEIEKLPGCFPATGGSWLAGELDHVYINSAASDGDVAAFTELEGLGHLRVLFVNGPRLSDATARKLGRLKSLQHLCLSGTGVSQTVGEELRKALPLCNVEIREENRDATR
jgi:hypothetical protein